MTELDKELREAQYAYMHSYDMPGAYHWDLVNIDVELSEIIGLIKHIVPWK